MSDIREKIMLLDKGTEYNEDDFQRGEIAGYYTALCDAADIAEAEVQRLEALVRELEEEVSRIKEKPRPQETISLNDHRDLHDFKHGRL